MNTKYIFITGGVVSSLGKGIISASLGKHCLCFWTLPNIRAENLVSS